MKRRVIFGISLLLVGIVSVQLVRVQAATLAVLVVGLETDAASEVFAAGIRYEFAQKGYDLVDNDAVKAKLADLRKDYKDGKTVDTVGIAAWGKTNNIDFVQLVVEKDCNIAIGVSTMSGREQITQMVSCSTEQYTGRGTYRTRFVTQEEMLEGMLKEMVFVEGGVFQMGCVSGRDDSCYANETAHWVQVNSFSIGKYPVTQRLWKMVMGDLPSTLKNNSAFLGEDKPVICASWNDVADTTNGFLKKLNDLTGRNYRLPTEAEWEYAARGCKGGSCESYAYSGSDVLEDVAWYDYNGPTISPQPVGGKSPNALGIYDMSGNVWDLCSDVYNLYYGSTSSDLNSTTQTSPIINPQGPPSGSAHVIRGGSWNDKEPYSRVAYRHADPPSVIFDDRGVRLV